jgi:hypothetical protein
MRSLAFFSKGRQKIYGLLLPAGEICGIARAIYLNPFLAAQLMLSWARQLLPDSSLSGERGRPPLRAKLSYFSADLRFLRVTAFAMTLLLPADGWADSVVVAPALPDAPMAQQGATAPAQAAPAGNDPIVAPPASAKPTETTAEMLKKEEHQRILGVVPNFNTVDNADTVARLSPRQKFHLAYKSSIDPFVFVADAFVAGLSQAQNSNPGFHQGAEGYFKRFGASYLDTVDGTLWGNAILPVLFKEDPRYFRLGHGSFKRRFLYSASTTVWCRRDNGTWGPGYANILGNFIAGGISNAYYPASDRGFEQTFDGAITVTAEGVIGAEFIEFWPDISRHLFKKHAAAP